MFNDTGLYSLQFAQMRASIEAAQRFLLTEDLEMTIRARYLSAFSQMIDALDDLKCAECETEPVSVQFRDRAMCGECATLHTECAACGRDVRVALTVSTDDGNVCQPCAEQD